MSDEAKWKRVDELLCEIHESGYHTGNLENAMEQRDALKMHEVLKEDFAIRDGFIEGYLQELSDLIVELMKSEVSASGKRVSGKEIELLGECLHIFVWEKFRRSCTVSAQAFKFFLSVNFSQQHVYFSVFQGGSSFTIDMDRVSVGDNFTDSAFDANFSQLLDGLERRFDEVSISGEYQTKDSNVVIETLK